MDTEFKSLIYDSQIPKNGQACEVLCNVKPVCKPNKMFWDDDFMHFTIDDYHLPKDAGHITWRPA